MIFLQQFYFCHFQDLSHKNEDGDKISFILKEEIIDIDNVL